MGIIGPSILATIDNARGLADTVVGLRLYTVQVVVTDTTGIRPGVGPKVVTKTTLGVGKGTARPKVVQLSQKNTIMSGGALTDVDLQVGPLTPPYPNSGNNTAFSIWNPTPPPAGATRTVRFLVTHAQEYPNGAMFKLHSYNVTKATRYMLVLRKTSEPVPT